MSIWSKLLSDRAEKTRLYHLKLDREDIYKEHSTKIDATKFKSANEYASAFNDLHSAVGYIDFEIDSIETERRLKKANKYEVPLPQRPKNYEDNEFWYWNSMIGEHFLTLEGHTYLRREIDREFEIRYRPWQMSVAWALGGSGLALSIFNFFWN